MSQETRLFYEFGDFRFDGAKHVLWRQGEMVALPPKATEVLAALLEQRGNLVERQELIDKVWADSFVEDGNLNHAVSTLRKVFGGDVIVTVPRRGYRFAGDIHVVESAGDNIVIERRAVSHTFIEQSEEIRPQKAKPFNRGLWPVLAVLVLALIGLGFWQFANRSTSGGPEQVNSIAVLPFENTGGDPNFEYLSDGVAESLINSLTELQQLKVIARSTAFRYKGKQVDPQQVGLELNVRTVLMGRARLAGDVLNVQVDLVDTALGTQLWGKEYEGKLTDLLSVKQNLTREVTEKLRLKLSGDDERRLVKRETTNPQAFEFYLRGRYLWNKRTANDLRKAIGEFQQAIDHDPVFALGYVGLADCYLIMEQTAGASVKEILPKARAATDRALLLDDSLAEARASSAHIYMNQWRWAEAEEEYKRSIGLNPNYPTAHQWFGLYYEIKLRFDDALKEMKRAEELDPLSPIIGTNVTVNYLLLNDTDAALRQAQKVIEFYPNYAEAYRHLGFTYFKMGRFDQATDAFQKSVEFSGRAGRYLGDLGYCYAATGKRAEALAVLKELEEKYRNGEAIGQSLAGVYAGLGEKDQALEWLEKDFEQSSGVLAFITFRIPFETLHSDPRFIDLVRRMGLEPL